MQATLRDELRVALWQGVAGRLEQETDAWVWRAGSDGRRSSGAVVRLATLGLEALTDDAGATGWLVEACKEKSVHNGGRIAISDVRRRTPGRTTLDEAFGKQPRREGLQFASLGSRLELPSDRA